MKIFTIYKVVYAFNHHIHISNYTTTDGFIFVFNESYNQ